MSQGMMLKPQRDLHHHPGRERELPRVVRRVVRLLEVLEVVRAMPYARVWLQRVQRGQTEGEKEELQALCKKRNITEIASTGSLH